MVAYVLIGLGEFAPIITIKSHNNLIIMSDFNRERQSSFATRLYSPNFVVSFSACTYPQLEIDESLSGIHTTFWAKTNTHFCDVYCYY